MSIETIFAWSLLARVLERVVLSAVVVIISVFLMRAFWKTLQKINFDLTSKEIGAKANIVIATPIFVLILLIGFSYVTFSHPISVTNPVIMQTSRPNTDAAQPSGGAPISENQLAASPKKTASENTIAKSTAAPKTEKTIVATASMAFYGSGSDATKRDIADLISIEQILRNESEKDRHNDAINQIKAVRWSLVKAYFGPDLYSNCQNALNSDFNSPNCLQLRKMIE